MNQLGFNGMSRFRVLFHAARGCDFLILPFCWDSSKSSNDGGILLIKLGGDITRPGPPNGGLVREIPGYFRKFQVGEILFNSFGQILGSFFSSIIKQSQNLSEVRNQSPCDPH